MRLDVYLVENGLAVSRAKAQEFIKNGSVCVCGKAISKPSYEVGEGESVEVLENPLQRYVGRGGLKLEAALLAFHISVKDKIALDVGASSGGFTDCLLQNGAAKVYAVDSGSGQLHPSLLADVRVENRENTNARYLSVADFSPRPTLAVMDVSFISQTLIHPALADVLPEGGILVSLIKPQFELDRASLDKKGIVKNEKLRQRAVERVKASALAFGFAPLGSMESVITGGDGNVEYIAAFVRKE